MATPRSPLMLIWSSMCTSIVIFFIVAITAAPDDPSPDDESAALALLVLGLMQSAVALVGAPLLFRAQPAQTAYIIRFGLMEAAATFGLVAYFLGAHLPAAALMGWALFGQMLQVPLPARVEAWEKARTGDGRR